MRSPTKSSKGLTVEEPQHAAGRYLGCEHKFYAAQSPELNNTFHISVGKPKKKNAEEGPNVKAKTVAKPAQLPRKMVRVVEYDQSNFLTACVEKYVELAGEKVKKLSHVDTPFLDESTKIPEGEPTGVLAGIASKVLMKILYAARMGRFDLLRATNSLARYVTKWGPTCDRRLHRLVCYINSTKHIKMVGWIGDQMKDLELQVYSDADFASDKDTQKSTTGIFMCLRGPHSFFPLSATSKKQGCVSHSTPEAEIVAINSAVRITGVPALDLFETIFQRKKMHINVHEDNETCARICKSGKNETMRHLQRTHNISIAWLHGQFQRKEFDVINEPTDGMCADIFTKGFTDKSKWTHAINLISHIDPKRVFGAIALPAPRVPGGKCWKTNGKATNFRLPGKNGPDMKSVYRRITFDDDINQVVEDEVLRDKEERSSYKYLTRSLPQAHRNHHISTKFYYKASGGLPAEYQNPAAPAASHPVKRRILEWCCGPNSRIGDHRDAKNGCEVTRITEKEDGTTARGLSLAQSVVVKPRCLLFSSMPCTGGSPWMRINVRRPGGYAILRRHIKLFNKLWNNFEQVARAAHAAGNYIAIEWPRGCSYWKLPKVRRLMKDLNLKFIHFDGCMLGLYSRKGNPIRKPWSIATNSECMIKEFQGCLCCGHKTHDPCAGSETKRTEGYTETMVGMIHRAFRKQIDRVHVKRH